MRGFQLTAPSCESNLLRFATIHLNLSQHTLLICLSLSPNSQQKASIQFLPRILFVCVRQAPGEPTGAIDYLRRTFDVKRKIVIMSSAGPDDDFRSGLSPVHVFDTVPYSWNPMIAECPLSSDNVGRGFNKFSCPNDRRTRKSALFAVRRSGTG
jgi:hypothetical protein